MNHKIINGDSAEELKNYPDNYFDSCVCDPPYGIEFLNKNWDNNTGAVEVWSEVYRTLKPGAYLLAFSAPRTYHRLASNLEELGFDIKDQLMWLYASEFPKAQDVGKMIQKSQGSAEIVTKWSGWKTALKPSHEPVVMARKPTKLSTPKNVEEWGTGALNVDRCRIGDEEITNNAYDSSWKGLGHIGDNPANKESYQGTTVTGRYPSNVIGEVEEAYQKYYFCPKVHRKERHIGLPDQNKTAEEHAEALAQAGVKWLDIDGSELPKHSHKLANKVKLPNGEVIFPHGLLTAIPELYKNGNNHPTVKPKALMGYLVRLVTPKGGKVFDPFAGSGSTGLGCIDEGMEYTGIELDEGYSEIAQKRLDQYTKDTNQTTYKDLFDEGTK